MRSLDFDTVWAATHGRRIVETLAEIAPQLDPIVEERALRQLMLAEGDDAFPAMDGAQDLLRELPPHCWAIVTSAKADNVRHRFRLAGLPIPQVLIDNEAVLQGKPSPEGFLAASTALGVAASRCLVVEDAPAGVRAGAGAGMRVLALATTHRPDELSEADDHAISLAAARPLIRRWVAEPL